MSASYDLIHGPLTLSQRRGKVALAGLGGGVFVAAGLWLLAGNFADPRATVTGALGIAFFGGVAARAVVALIRPNRLTIEQAGLTLDTPFQTRRWAWTDLEAIELINIRRAKVIVFQSRTASKTSAGLYRALGLKGNGGLPGGWPITTPKLFALLTEAKARWG